MKSTGYGIHITRARIVTNGSEFRPEQRGWLGWKPYFLEEWDALCDDLCDGLKRIRFDTEAAARAFLEATHGRGVKIDPPAWRPV